MPAFLKRPAKPALAYNFFEGDAEKPMVVFLGGYRSDMQGTKALYLEEQCKACNQSFLRFDYSGHGESEGDFNDGTIGAWAGDALDIIDMLTGDVPLILVGSSMGGWIAFLTALARKDKVRGLVGIAAAPDFTIDFYENRMTEQNKKDITEKGYTEIPNDYSDTPYYVTREFIEDGLAHCLLERGIGLDIPVRLIQGKQDADVPWQHAYTIQKAITGEDVQVILVEDGDHRLSKPEELDIIWQHVQNLL